MRLKRKNRNRKMKMINNGTAVNYPLITKEQFIKYMEAIKNTIEKESKLSKAFEDIEPQDGMYFLTLYTEERNALISLLEEVMCAYRSDEYGSDIQYFIYELDWGKNWNPDSLRRGDGTPIVMYDEATLYDFLVEDYWYRTTEVNKRASEDVGEKL